MTFSLILSCWRPKNRQKRQNVAFTFAIPIEDKKNLDVKRMFNKTDEQKRKQIETEYQKALEQKKALEIEDAKVKKEKDTKLQRKKSIEYAFKQKAFLFGVDRVGSIRLLLYLRHVSMNPQDILDKKVAESFRVVEILDAIDKLGLPPMKKPEFDSENNPI